MAMPASGPIRPVRGIGSRETGIEAKAAKVTLDPLLSAEVLRRLVLVDPMMVFDALLEGLERLDTMERSGTEYLERYGRA